MDLRNPRYTDNDSLSKSKSNRSKNKKNKSKSKKLSSSSVSNLVFQKTVVDKKTAQKPISGESISRKTNLESQTSSVLLGFPDCDIPEQVDNDPYTTKIGGKPSWLCGSHPLSHDVIICKNCGKDMFLLFQGYVPLENSVYDRVIYVFGCNQQKCMNKNGSFRAYRSHRKDEEYERRYQQERISKYRSNNSNNNSSTQSSNVINRGLGDMLFEVSDFDNKDEMQISEKEETSEEEDAVKNRYDEKEKKYNSKNGELSSWSKIVSDAEKARNKRDQISNKCGNNDDVSQVSVDMSMMTLESNWPKNVQSFPARYLYVTEEILEDKRNDDILKYEEVQKLLENDDNSDWFGEKYEKPILPKGYNKTFQKFSDRVAEWPDQCVRYQFGGQPLLYTHNDEAAKLFQNIDNCVDKVTSSKLPVCQWCGSNRIFELQLMPSILSILSTSSYIDKVDESSDKKSDNSLLNLGMEWGTIMVFTCKNDCEKIGVGSNGVAYYEEIVMVQYEQ